jgi:hypothetical protein
VEGSVDEALLNFYPIASRPLTSNTNLMQEVDAIASILEI